MVGGIDVAKLRNGQVYKLRRKLGIVFQDFKLLPKLTVYENVAYGLETQGMKKKEIKPKVIKALERVGLKEKIRSFPHQLSGGEQQRVCIARAIVNKPKLLICDEPTGNLDPKTSKEIVDVLNNINQELKTTIIMATHDKEIVNTMKKRVVLIENGGISGDFIKGTYKDHYEKYKDESKEQEEQEIVKKTEKLIKEKKKKDKQIEQKTKSIELDELQESKKK